VLDFNAEKPTAVLLFATLQHKAKAPKAVLFDVVELYNKLYLPIAVLFAPAELLPKALRPKAELPYPLVLLLSALAPTLTLLATFPPPSPISTPLTMMSCALLKEPVTLTLPVNWCVLDKLEPNIVEPVIKLVEEVMT
jgi:hypothetical protein